MNGRVLITGANGYLGSQCVERFAGSSEREVVAVWRSKNQRLLMNPPSHIHYEQCDLTDRAAVEGLISRWNIHLVLHAAALLPDGGPNYLHRAVLSNIAATANLVECSAAFGCRRFVYCSSISVYGAAPCPEIGWTEGSSVLPSSIYGWTKYAGEECVRFYSSAGGLTGVTLRLAGIHGRGRRDGATFQMMRAALAGEPLVVNSPTNRFQLVFLDDALDGLALSLTIPLRDSYQCINLASHTFPSLRHMAKRIVEYCGSQSVIETGSTQPEGDHVMNLDAMRTVLGLTPREVEAGWQRIHEWLQKE